MLWSGFLPSLPVEAAEVDVDRARRCRPSVGVVGGRRAWVCAGVVTVGRGDVSGAAPAAVERRAEPSARERADRQPDHDEDAAQPRRRRDARTDRTPSGSSGTLRHANPSGFGDAQRRAVRFRIWSSIVFHAEAGPPAPEDAVQVASSFQIDLVVDLDVAELRHLVVGDADDERTLADPHDRDRRVATERPRARGARRCGPRGPAVRRPPVKPRLRSTFAATHIRPITTASEKISRDEQHERRGGGHQFSSTHDLGDADAELLVDDDDFAVPHERAVDEHVDGAAGGAVELDHRSGSQGDDVAHLQPPAPELGGDFHVHVVQQRERARRARGADAVVQRLELVERDPDRRVRAASGVGERRPRRRRGAGGRAAAARASWPPVGAARAPRGTGGVTGSSSTMRTTTHATTAVVLEDRHGREVADDAREQRLGRDLARAGEVDTDVDRERDRRRRPLRARAPPRSVSDASAVAASIAVANGSPTTSVTSPTTPSGERQHDRCGSGRRAGCRRQGRRARARRCVSTTSWPSSSSSARATTARDLGDGDVRDQRHPPSRFTSTTSVARRLPRRPETPS